MPSQATVIGPFVGGLNKGSDASAIGDNELSECINLNVDLDGSLVCRPPIAEMPVGYNTGDSITYVSPFGGRALVIGQANVANVPYIIVSSPNGVFALKVVFTDSGVDWTEAILIHSTLQSDCAIQLHNVVFILSRYDCAAASGIWDGLTWAADAGAPKGSAAIFFKGRVFVAPGSNYDYSIPSASQLVFSDPVPIAIPVAIPWNPVNLIPVGQGDGENLVDMLVVADNLMLFKNNSTYAYLYDVNPNEGILRKVNNDIGVSTQFCALTEGNEAYVYHEGKVYQIANYTFIETNLKLPFSRFVTEDSRREKVCLSLVGKFILVRYFDYLYALNLTTKTWSQWSSGNGTLNSLGRVIKLETNEISSTVEGYFGGSVLSSNSAIMRIKETHTLEDEEFYLVPNVVPANAPTKTPLYIECTMATKVFDFGTPHLFKRLMWWGVDIISNGNVSAVANPIRQTLDDVSWEDLAEYNWDQLFTWDNPLANIEYVITNVNDVFQFRRKFIKLLKSLRFRQTAFIVKFWSNGQIAPEQTLGPARVFTLSAIVGAKQTVVKQVS